MKKISDEKIARIMLHRACNKSFREIAEELNINKSTVTRYIYEMENQADETSVEETVMNRLSPLARMVIAGNTQHSEADK